MKKNKHVIIVKADKGGCTVAMLREDYNVKMSELLNDNSTYAVCTQNPANRLEAISNSLIEKLFKEKIIDEEKRKSMIRHNTQLSRIYALP